MGWPGSIYLLALLIGAGVATNAVGANVQTSTTASPASANSTASVNKKARIATRLEWNRKTLFESYDRIGKHSPKWDKDAREALKLYAEMRSHSESVTEFPDELLNAAHTAVDNGCDDPMVRYINMRWRVRAQVSRRQLQAEYTDMANSMGLSPYGPLRKFFAFYHTSEYYDEVSTAQSKAIDYLLDALKDKTMPIEEVYDATSKLINRLKDRPGSKKFYESAEPILMTNWPNASEVWLLRGLFYVNYAFQFVAEDETHTGLVVMPAGIPIIEKNLAEAEKGLTNAWEINPNDARIARWMINVELWQHRGRDRMETWFARAMKLDTNYFQACFAKLIYLQPKWNGTDEDMIEFGHECVTNKNWGPTIPLILVSAHDQIAEALNPAEQAAYWKKPTVWNDIKLAYETVLAKTNDVSYRKKYLQYAVRAADRNEINHQSALINKMESAKAQSN